MRRSVPLLVTLVAAACGGGDDTSQSDDPFTTTTEQGAPSTTATTAPSTTTTAVNVDPAVLPTEVTVEYAQAVMEELVHIEGEILRLAVAREDPARAAELSQAIYEEAYGEFRAGVLIEEAVAGFIGVSPTPGDRIVTVLRIIEPGPECVGLEVENDFRPIAPEVGTVSVSIVELTLGPPPGEAPLNPTPYVIDDERPVPPGTEPFVPC